MPHILKKQFKFKPALANGDTPRPVVFIALIVWVSASGFHVTPDFIHFTLMKSVGCLFYGRIFSLQATTTLGMVIVKMIGPY